MRGDRDTGQLNDFAGYQLAYDVRMLVCQAYELLSRYPDGLPDGFRDHTEDALLEAWLVHLRLLDEFLRLGQRTRGNAIARDWFREWRSTGFLTRDERTAIEAQVSHINWSRKKWSREQRPPWGDIRRLTEACCRELLRFFAEVEGACSRRHEAFDKSLDLAEKFVQQRLTRCDCPLGT
ncbi:MAG TPA: hypothetical protein VJ375_16855 [Gaiellaceae bacterium]|nr:hypothetical protein [Gaiellaceae bacterium]